MSLPYQYMPERLSLSKKERLCSRVLIDELFSGGKSVSCFPIRIVYRLYAGSESASDVSVLFNVSKKHFKRAVRRNRVKRQFREMYRHSREQVVNAVRSNGCSMTMAVVFCDDRLWNSELLSLSFDRALDKLMSRISSFSEDAQ